VQIVWNWTVNVWGANCSELDCIVLGANCVELDCIGLGGKLGGTELYRFGGQIVWNWTV
jgi:hypothetical protein